MAQRNRLLIFSKDTATAASLVTQLRREGCDAVAVTRAADAVAQLRERPVDFILADARLAEPSAVDFLAKARQYVPWALRALFEPAPVELDLRDAINKAAPCAIFTGSVHGAQIRALIEREGRAPADPTQPDRPDSGRAAEDPPARETRPAAPPETPPPTPPPRAHNGPHNAAATAPSAPRVSVPLPAKEGTRPRFDPHAPDLVAEVARVLDTLIDAPDIQLPVLPQVGFQVQKLISQESSTFEQIAEKVGLDQSMSARILEVANSPLYAGVEQIRNLQHAVSRIGLRETRNILQVVAAENLFKTRDKKIATCMASLWMHSLACAYGNETLAKFLSIAESSDFFMMGLLHDIGKLLIIHLIQQGYEMGLWTSKMITEAVLHELLRKRHADLGLRLMEKWGYPEPFPQVVARHNDDERVQECHEAVVVTYFSNLLTRKMGLSLVEHDPRLLDRREIAQALNMSPEAREHIETSMAATVEKIKASFTPRHPR